MGREVGWGVGRGWKQLIEMDPEEAPVLYLLVKVFKSAIINMSKELNETMSKELKESKTMMFYQIKNSNKEIEIILPNFGV